MRQQRNISLLLVGCLLFASFTGCGKKQAESSQETVSVNDSSSAVEQTTKESIPLKDASPSSDPKMVITIDTVEISEEELKAQDYIVTLYVNLEKNAGISYSEWGLSYDERCEMSANVRRLDYNTVYAFNDEKPFLWTAWSGGAQIYDYETPVLQLEMKLPEDATTGDFFPVKYESVSLADKPHKWSDGEHDWVALDAVSWNDGGVKVVVSAD